MKIAVFWVVAPWPPHQGDALTMKAARTSETPVNVYQAQQPRRQPSSFVIVFITAHL
jgi:hypothetical protein